MPRPGPLFCPPTGRPLAEALNPDGTLRAGATGSFDARQFRMRTAPDGRPVFRPAGVAGAGDERWANGFRLNGTNGTVDAVLRSGADIYIGGTFMTVGNVVANRVAKWNGTAWSPLGSGTNDYVFKLVVGPTGKIYAQGAFSTVGAPRRPLTLSDARGRLVRRYPAPAGPDAPLDLRGLPAGFYLVRCGQFTQRLVVE